MIDKINKYFKLSLRISGILIFLSAPIFKYMSRLMPLDRGMWVSIVLHTISVCGVLTVISSFLSIKFRKFIIIFISFIIAMLATLPQLSIAILTIIPILLALYTLDRKYINFIAILNSILFICSRLGKAYNEYCMVDFISGEKNLKLALLGAGITAIIEACVVIGSGCSLLKFILKQNEDLKQELLLKEKASSELLNFSSTATSYHNKYLRWHIHGVKRISEILIDGLKLKGYNISDGYKNQILFAVQFHDIGKIYIDPAILDKPGKLTEEEFELVKEHPLRGYDLFTLIPKNSISVDTYNVCKNVIIQHHERLNGSGYPFNLTEEKISLEAKIVAVADVADALLSWRPYKNPMTWEKMISIFEEQQDCYLDICIEVLKEHKNEIMEISEKNNFRLKNMLCISDDELERLD